ncbi:chemotaxis-specific protein-glutamate methyltransferase CheB [Siccirubricoccus sp. KC 17139]|uniref:Protein-glutamate methylesterase/protein-glutamine glutaminase n=2 Tax=Siccirubricoccus soli TaxID=2899147 RepID=A0ABT1CZQ9_9PROT|nr:chemotaxis-specific protein-glutamate methyltransferase CheB [Siccirubricoccus soli]MCO6414902.1 chemotaxis-specific protein-glutamate methyltransferase CheB [Siccirubricoccus soli]MCP2681032.1 chemotaxis-specific protein-glutamate methyltransferase CheB [Siccirubricoccus soli]
MLCDDSATVRSALARVLEADPEIKVVARAGDGRQALETLAGMSVATRPQVVLLDLEMPVMDGMTALPLLLKLVPRPVVIVASALTQKGAAVTMAALRAGAADYIPKPGAAGGGLHDASFRAELVAKVKGWARMGRAVAAPRPSRPAQPSLVALLPRRGVKAIGIGCSTGGPQALATLVRGLNRKVPVPVVAVQHMPAGFTAMLADHLNRLGTLGCAEARDGEVLEAGRLYLAPGDRHLLVEAANGRLVARLNDGPPENFCRPAVDPMLRSLNAACEGAVLAVILTGMGHDGLAGCKAVAAAGGAVLAQDEASSVVWGMPGAVARAGLARAQLPPEGLAEQVLALVASRAGAFA